MSGEWPADPSDPSCPDCGEPVSATASYCMHCESDLPPAGFGDSTTEPVDDAPIDEADPGMPTRDDDREGDDGLLGGVGDEDTETGEDTEAGDDDSWSGGAGGDDGTDESGDQDAWGTDDGTGSRFGGGSRTGAARERAGEKAEEAAAWIDPDSLLDDVSTVVVGVVTAVLTLVLGTILAYGILPPVVDAAAPWIALAATAGAGLWVGRTRSVFGAARKAGLVVGAQVALVPVAFALAMPWESAGDAVGGGFFLGIIFWPIAAIVAGVGWVLGMGGVDEDEEA